MDHQMNARNRSSLARRPRQAGFSLIELMTVVLITGILAAIAIPTFSGYVFKSRTSEAVQFLGVIKLKQEGYRAEFGAYAPSDGRESEPTKIRFTPAVGSMKGETIAFSPVPPEFTTLGAVPSQAVRFAYGWAAGTPGDAATNNLNGLPYEVQPPYDHYFVAQAVSDLNADGTTCTFELTSFTRQIWYSPSRGWH